MYFIPYIKPQEMQKYINFIQLFKKVYLIFYTVYKD